MGGPGGHMWHPFDCPDVNSGKDLMDFFGKSVEWLSQNPAGLKIDGVNLSFRLRQNPNISPGWEFVVDRGATSGRSGKLDLAGVTADNAHLRFINKYDPSKPHGMVGATATLLNILNSALPALMPELKQLGFLQDGGHGPYGLYFNTEFVLKKINVKEYPFNFIALHGIRQFLKKSDRARTFKDIPVDKTTLDKLRDKLHEYGMKNSPPFRVFSTIETKFKHDPNLKKVYNVPIPINTGGAENTKTLGARLLEVQESPYGQKIVLKESVAEQLGIPQTQDPFAKKIYMAVHQGALVPEMVANKDHIEPIVDAYVMQHAVRLIGNEILDASSNDLFGSARDQEGIVIGPTPDICGGTVFKYTGDFIVGGLASSFKSHAAAPGNEPEQNKSTAAPEATDTRENPQNDLIKEQVENSPIKKVIAVYPGRFQPAGRHHAAAWTWLQAMFGADETYIATSDVVKLPKSPFNFYEKQEILKAHGVPDEKIVQTKNPYQALEITSQYDPNSTAVVFMVGEKDMKEDPRFKNVGGTLKSGKAAYYKNFKDNKDQLEPLSNHGYLITAPHVSLNVPGHGEMSGTSLREYIKQATPEQFQAVMGWYDKDLYDTIQSRLQGQEPPKEDSLDENFLSMDSLYSLVDESLHQKYKNFIGLNQIVSMVDRVILETEFATMQKQTPRVKNNINETNNAELNNNIKALIAKLLSGSLKKDAEDLADIGEPLANDWTEQMVDAIKTARSDAAEPEDIVNQMAEVSGAGGGGVAGYAGNAWQKKKKRNQELTR